MMGTVPLDSFLSMFQGSIEFTFGPHKDEPLIMANKIENLANNLTDFELPLTGARQIVVDDMKNRFDNEVDLSGKKWKRRSKTTIEMYKKQNVSYSTILRRSSDLYDAVTDIDSYDILENDLFINTSGWPDYWAANDQGASVGRTSILPQRQFVGLSATAQFEVIDIFDHWLDGNLQIIRPGVSNVAMFRGAFGRVGGRISLGMHHPRRTGAIGELGVREQA